MASDQDRLMAEIYRKIDRERALIHAASSMQRATNNASVQSRADTSIREARKNIDYLEERLRTLQLQMQPSGPPTPQHGGQGQYGQQQGRNMVGSPGPTPPPKDQNGRPYGGGEQGDYGEPGPGGYSQGGTGSMPPRAPFADNRPFQPVPKARPNFSKLGRIYNTVSRRTHRRLTVSRSYQIRHTLPRSQDSAYAITIRVQVECRKTIQGGN
jgi:Hr1 repeat